MDFGGRILCLCNVLRLLGYLDFPVRVDYSRREDIVMP